LPVDSHARIKHAMGIASLAFGVAGILKPEPLARWTGAETAEARGLGFRDLAIGFAIYANPEIGLAQRAIVDVGDAVTFARRKRLIVPLGLGSAALAAYALSG
jgi:hypothetical protein